MLKMVIFPQSFMLRKLLTNFLVLESENFVSGKICLSFFKFTLHSGPFAGVFRNPYLTNSGRQFCPNSAIAHFRQSLYLLHVVSNSSTGAPKPGSLIGLSPSMRQLHPYVQYCRSSKVGLKCSICSIS
jgi:hypothetical protein